ncbi:MAG: protein-L-isoaspartate(D-aspartate) O-methyltransferase [Deltaproteobacteria bacterium]|nr:protein-L-isoaspartate(D-aspartate) O-methyltransferase [Deltaproteobacteria bacterium]
MQCDRCETRPRASRAGLVGALALWLVSGCGLAESAGSGGSRSLVEARNEMVERQLAARDIRDARVLEAMRKVRRHRYAPDLDPVRAYEDRPHSIGEGQTISQPYIVALMSELARVEPPCKVLEVGTGSGYQAAVLAEMGCTVYTIEIVEPLARRARKILDSEGYGDRVRTRVGDGYRGWPEQAPFDAVVVTAAAPRVPRPLLEQLREGGRLVIPVGEGWQMLEVHRRTTRGFEREKITSVRFVPMTGEIRRRP